MNISVYKPTQDDWYGNYLLKRPSDIDGLGLVQVMFTQTGPLPPFNGKWRVCDWGNDDCGMEKDFEHESEALNTFYRVIGWDFVNKEILRQEGFVSA